MVYLLETVCRSCLNGVLQTSVSHTRNSYRSYQSLVRQDCQTQSSSSITGKATSGRLASGIQDIAISEKGISPEEMKPSGVECWVL